MGSSIGNFVAPPVAGALYQRWGFRAPFIFGIFITGIDLLARILLIERHEAMRWGVDPMVVAICAEERDPEVASGVTALSMANKPLEPEIEPTAQERSGGSPVCEGEGSADVEIEEEAREDNQREKQPQESKQSRVILLPHIVLLKLAKSLRAAVCTFLTLILGLVLAAQETTVVLHLNRVWGLDPHQAGIAFIAATVPAIFCQYRMFSPLVTHSNRVDCSWDPFWLVGR
jgi:MFS family permease